MSDDRGSGELERQVGMLVEDDRAAGAGGILGYAGSLLIMIIGFVLVIALIMFVVNASPAAH